SPMRCSIRGCPSVPDASATAVAAGAAPEPRTGRVLLALQGAWRFLRGEPFAVVGGAIYALIVFVAVFADRIAPYDPHAMLRVNHRLAKYLPISAEHWLGTTADSRDIFSQLIFGTRAALEVGLTAAFCVVATGTMLGLLAGYLGG